MSKETKHRIWVVTPEGSTRRQDYLITEEPLEIQLKAGETTQTVAITMRTPGNDYELTAGFLYNEGVIQSKYDFSTMTYCVGEDRDQQEYNQLMVSLHKEKLPDLPQLDRHFVINSACGICGKTILDDLATRNLPELSTDPLVDAATIYQMPQIMRQEQTLFKKTGGLHAAALFSFEGKLLCIREDVGRHNALDKLIGWGVLNDKLPFQNGIVVVSARASYELLQKTRIAGAPIFCAVSAPSSLAVSLAENFDVTLIAFLREQRFNIYTHAERIRGVG